MGQNKTTPTNKSVQVFLDSVENEKRRADATVVMHMMQRVTGENPVLWGPSIVGFGRYHYKYASGREGDHCITGLSPRKAALTVYIMPGFEPFPDLMKRLGKYKTSRSCLRINKLEDVDMDVLEELVAQSIELMRQRYPD